MKLYATRSARARICVVLGWCGGCGFRFWFLHLLPFVWMAGAGWCACVIRPTCGGGGSGDGFNAASVIFIKQLLKVRCRRAIVRTTPSIRGVGVRACVLNDSDGDVDE